jgi:hypothetical protein
MADTILKKATWNGDTATRVRVSFSEAEKVTVEPGETVEVTEEVANYLKAYSKDWSFEGIAKASEEAAPVRTESKSEAKRKEVMKGGKKNRR